MKKILLLGFIAAISGGTAVAQVGVSVSVGDPGFYGRIDIGSVPQPRLIYREPIIVERVYGAEPVYMHVPPGHAKNWKKHCRHYDACGRPVYFVQDDWYNEVYVPRYREIRSSRDGHGHDHGGHGDHKGGGKDHGGKGNGKGGGNGKGQGNGKGHSD